MEVQCPQCQSRFHIPDAAVRPNVKLRCSVCKHVFRYEDPATAAVSHTQSAAVSAPPTAMEAPTSSDAGADLDLDSPPTGGKKKEGSKSKGKIFISIFILLLCIGGGVGAWWYFDTKSPSTETANVQVSKSIELITMRDVRQYYVKNEKIGSIFVVEGKMVNDFPIPKELIEVEAAIYAADKTVLASKKQLAGTALSLFQLQVLGKEELESFLHNEIEILTKNTNVPSGGEVPFMVLFYNPPAEVTEFGVKVFSAKDVKKN